MVEVVEIRKWHGHRGQRGRVAETREEERAVEKNRATVMRNRAKIERIRGAAGPPARCLCASESLRLRASASELPPQRLRLSASASEYRLAESPDEQRDADGNQQREPAAEQAEVAEAVAAAREDHQVGLVADGRGEGA